MTIHEQYLKNKLK